MNRDRDEDRRGRFWNVLIGVLVVALCTGLVLYFRMNVALDAPR